MARHFWFGLLGYALPTFSIAYVWHLIVFADVYDALEIYRDDMIIPFGLIAVTVQGGIFSWLYGRAFAPRANSWPRSGLAFGALAGVLSWTFTTVAVAAKHPMSSVPNFMLIETAFTVVQFAVAGPLIALAYRGGAQG